MKPYRLLDMFRYIKFPNKNIISLSLYERLKKFCLYKTYHLDNKKTIESTKVPHQFQHRFISFLMNCYIAKFLSKSNIDKMSSISEIVNCITEILGANIQIVCLISHKSTIKIFQE